MITTKMIEAAVASIRNECGLTIPHAAVASGLQAAMDAREEIAAMTERQREALNFIDSFCKMQGHSPSIQEVADGLAMKSKNTAYRVIRQLVDRGAVEKHVGRQRSLKVLV